MAATPPPVYNCHIEPEYGAATLAVLVGLTILLVVYAAERVLVQIISEFRGTTTTVVVEHLPEEEEEEEEEEKPKEDSSSPSDSAEEEEEEKS